ncbi:metal ABC transporter solute-binding protein, Zn/Mn family [Litchfieldia salsa]|uniref:metal ABC transporter solute-binding protein, Zn/Mn family n=1 Tax=Litchfieldia salsa TaxID=930152 RepID=UPI001EE46357|nr:zinc ABC transporter substrate-binding protein [Litchfieldia salsa]
MQFKQSLSGVLIVLFLILAGCNNEQTDTSTTTVQKEDVKQLKIYTTIYPLEDFTKRIGGEHVDVETILPPGSDAHTYQPTSKQMINIAEADAFIYNGLGMEPFSEKIGAALKNEKVLIVEASHGVETISFEEEDHGHEDDHNDEDSHEHPDNHNEDDEHGHSHGDFDPHIWLDPHRSIILAENIKNTLVELSPDTKEQFEKNFETLKSELKNLDNEFHNLVASKNQPEMIVSHAAYGYWEESYGIHQIPVAGLSQSNEPSQQELKRIIDLAKDKQIKFVIFEQNVKPILAEVIRKEINAEPLKIHNLSVLTEEDKKNGEDFFSLMRKNLETLDQALN